MHLFIPMLFGLSLFLVRDGQGAWQATQRPLVGPSTDAATFHHLHLVRFDSAMLADHYARLFVSTAITRGRFFGLDGVRGQDGSMLLFSAGLNLRHGNEASAFWHFGWGPTTLDQPYRLHYLREVDWKPPYRSFSRELHVHLRSAEVRAAADWYRTVLGAAVQLSAQVDAPADPDEMPARAVARIGDLTLVFHPFAEPVVSSRESGTVDHLAFAVRDPAAVAARHQLTLAPEVRAGLYALPDVPAVTITGPDRVVIELVRAPRDPAFWR
jgi:catechol 2,3-dioxygenase-like lactoylglutathione lyase family enzyme